MFKATILFTAEAETEDEVVDKVMFDMHEIIRREGEGIKIEELKEPVYETEKDFYILTIWNGVEPVITGPFLNPDKRLTALTSLKKEYGEESPHYPVDISKGAGFEIGVFKP